MNLVFIGDIHNQLNKYLEILEYLDKKYGKENYHSFQIGDFGFDAWSKLPKLTSNHHIINGNHDNPNLFQPHPNWLGKYGYLKDFDLFYLSGAYSPDKNQRTIGIDWWPEEELNQEELTNAINLFKTTKPKILITHDCASFVKKYLFNIRDYTKTSSAIDCMLTYHKCDINIFGHWHKDIDQNIFGSRFICIKEFGIFELNI